MASLAEGPMENRTDLLCAAEDWTELELEDRYQQLLDHIHSILADQTTTLELRYRYYGAGTSTGTIFCWILFLAVRRRGYRYVNEIVRFRDGNLSFNKK
jgi:hypothetical protein